MSEFSTYGGESIITHCSGMFIAVSVVLSEMVSNLVANESLECLVWAKEVNSHSCIVSSKHLKACTNSLESVTFYTSNSSAENAKGIAP